MSKSVTSTPATHFTPNAIVIEETSALQTVKSGSVSKEVYVLHVATEDGKSKEVRVLNPAMVQTCVDIEYLSKIAEASKNMFVARLATIERKSVEALGFKSVATFVQTVCGSRLDGNTLNKYVRVAKIFVDPETGAFREPLSQTVSVSNLCDCLRLFTNIEWKKSDSYTPAEWEQFFNDFVDMYVNTDRISLDATQKVLRKQIAEILNPSIITATAEEISSEPLTEGEPTAEEPTEETEAEAITAHISALSDLLSGNAEAEKLLADLVELLNK